MNHQLEQHAGLITHMAIGAARACGLQHEFEDVLQEAWVAACEALRRYNPDKAQLSTYIGNAVYYRVISYYGRREVLAPLPEWYDAADKSAPEYEFRLWLSELTEREQEMVAYTLQPEAGRKTSIVEHFARRWGWAPARQTAARIKAKLALAYA